MDFRMYRIWFEGINQIYFSSVGSIVVGVGVVVAVCPLHHCSPELEPSRSASLKAPSAL